MLLNSGRIILTAFLDGYKERPGLKYLFPAPFRSRDAFLRLLLWLLPLSGWAIPLIENGEPAITLTLGSMPDPLEVKAATALDIQFYRYTQKYPSRRSITPFDGPFPRSIAIGTPVSHPTIALAAARGILRFQGLGMEGYHLRLSEDTVLIGANSPAGVFYGTHAFIETMIAHSFGKTPVDVDFQVRPVAAMQLNALDERSAPSFPIRATLEVEDPYWLASHRVNVSGGEGIWEGTGIYDGLGAAVQYLEGWEPYQDRGLPQRVRLLQDLRFRTQNLREHGIASFLFMYVTGEPTVALLRERPELFGPPVPYAAARGGGFYHPFCWSKPEVHSYVAELTRELVRTYPDLSGFHLRAWGWETRACDCEECGGSGEKGQETLWNLVHTLIAAAREARPTFRFLLSDYDRSWFRDPKREHLKRLPPGTILLNKWGYDGEPTDNPNVPLPLVRDVRTAGHHLLILSHETEEAQPLWMLEAEMFSRGVRPYVDSGLGGFTLQGQLGLSLLDRRLSARIGWTPSLDPARFVQNALENRYGAQAAAHLTRALLQNSRTLTDFFSDYGGFVTLTGGYRHGSTSFATRFWDLFGVERANDIFRMPNLETAQYARRRLSDLMTEQRQATELAHQAQAVVGQLTDTDFEDAVNLMETWLHFFETRRALVDTVAAGYASTSPESLASPRNRAVLTAEQMRESYLRIRIFIPLIGATPEGARDIALQRMDAELERIRSYDLSTLLRRSEEKKSEAEPLPPGAFGLSSVLNTPNPLADETTFTYFLPGGADTVVIDIYSAGGRRVRRLANASTEEGYNETFWDGRDAEGTQLATGTYFFRITARKGEETIRAIGKLAVLR